MMISGIVDYTCNEDILFKFRNGIGLGALENITEVVITAYEDSSEDQKDNAIMTLECENKCISHNLEIRELLLRNDTLEKSSLVPGNSYCVEFHGSLADGTFL